MARRWEGASCGFSGAKCFLVGEVQGLMEWQAGILQVSGAEPQMVEGAALCMLIHCLQKKALVANRKARELFFEIWTGRCRRALRGHAKPTESFLLRLQQSKQQQEQQLHQQRAKKMGEEALTRRATTGFAHVTFATEEIAKAVSMNGQEFLGRVSRVDFA